MSGVHLHLIVNHLPVVGALFALLATAWALWRKGRDTAIFGMACLVLLGAFSALAYFSGEPAEEAVEDMAAVSHSYIEEHEDAAWIAFLAAAAAGMVGAAGLVARGDAARKWTLPIGFVAAAVTLGLMGWTANLGGMVRHTEIHPAGAASERKTEAHLED